MTVQVCPEAPTLYQIDTRWGCGGLLVVNGVVVDSAPIFWKLRGEQLSKLQRIYKVVECVDSPMAEAVV